MLLVAPQYQLSGQVVYDAAPKTHPQSYCLKLAASREKDPGG
jgi:hypothetical protein